MVHMLFLQFFRTSHVYVLMIRDYTIWVPQDKCEMTNII